MTIIVRHPELDGNRWTKVVVGQGGALIRPETYQIVPDILHEDCEQVGEGLCVAGGEWLTSPQGTLYRSAGIHIEGNGSMVGLLVVDTQTGARRRLGAATMRSMTPVGEGTARNMLGRAASEFDAQLQDRGTHARVQLERAEGQLAIYRALVSVKHTRDEMEARESARQAAPVHDERVWTVSEAPTTFQQELEQASPPAGTPEEVAEAANRVVGHAQSYGASTTTLNDILRQYNESPSEPFRGTVRRRRW